MNTVKLSIPKIDPTNTYYVIAKSHMNGDYAEYSDDYIYRYVLKRNFPNERRWRIPIVFIMLNPSTATEAKNDPTIRRCISFAQREGCTELFVVNLFAFRATNPQLLEKDNKDPIGPMNDKKIGDIISKVRASGGRVVAAWGSRTIAVGRGAELERKFGPFLCLGLTKNGHPRHPLYVKSDQQFMEYK